MLSAWLWLISGALLVSPAWSAGVAPYDPATARWSSRGPFGGEVWAIAVDPTDARVAYAALGSIYSSDDHRIGGVFKTFDGASTWKEIGPPDMSFFSVAVAPSDHRVVFASSYEGLWKSADAGVEWSMVLPGISYPAPPAIDPADPLHVWVISDGAAWRSLDGGSTWTHGFDNAEAVGFDSGRPSRLHRVRLEEVAIDYFSLRFAYTDDRGETWSPSTAIGRPDVGGIVSDPSDPNTIYSDGKPIYRSTDRGASWTSLGGELLIHSLVVDPLSPTSLYASALNNGLVVSHDSGLTWTTILDVLARPVAVAPSNGHTRIFAGSSRGLFFSDDGETWIASNEGLRGAAWYALALDPRNSSKIYTVGRAGFASSADGGASWSEDSRSLASGSALAVSPFEPSLILASGAGIVRSRDAGATWQIVFGRSGGYTSAIVFDLTNPSVVYCACFFPLKSTDGGESWRITNQGLESIGIFTIAIDSADAAVLYTISRTGQGSNALYRSLDGAESWVRDPALAVGGVYGLYTILPDPGRPGVAWLGTSKGLFRGGSSDTTWSPTGFTDSVSTIATDGSPNGAIYVYSPYKGVFRSLDAGITWEPLGTGLPPANIYSLVADAAGGVLYAAANDGVYSLDLRLRPRVVPPR
jgi:photosystem II stability/assembly factor-like uncharacterized protein